MAALTVDRATIDTITEAVLANLSKRGAQEFPVPDTYSSATTTELHTPPTTDAPTYGKEVALFDIHHPHHNKPAMASIMTFLGDYKPEVLILGGDALDAGPFSHWNEKKLNLLRKEKPPAQMYSEFVADLLVPMRKVVGDSCYIVYLLGNHEDWVRQAIEADPKGEGYWEVEKNLDGIPDLVVPYVTEDDSPNHFALGKLHFTHGYCTNLHHAKKVADDYNRPVRVGHTHTKQLHTHRTVVDVRDFHIAQSCGCLCNLNPIHAKNRPNAYVHAVQYGEVLESGAFADDVPVIIDGVFKAEGVWYGR